MSEEQPEKPKEALKISAPAVIPEQVTKWGEQIQITKRGAVFSANAEKIPPSTAIDLLKKLAAAETACEFAIGDITNFLIGMKGKELLEIADATGISAGDLKKRANTCQRIEYGKRVEQLHFDFHAEAAKAKTDDAEQWLRLTTAESLDRKGLKKSIELGRLATEDDMKPVIEENDGGTENYGVAVNRIVVLNGKMERADYYAKQSVEKLYGIHRVLFPVVKIWVGIVRRFKDKLPDDLQKEFAADMETIQF